MHLKNLNYALRVLVAAVMALISGSALAVDLNMPEGVTPISHEVYDLHMYGLLGVRRHRHSGVRRDDHRDHLAPQSRRPPSRAIP